MKVDATWLPSMATAALLALAASAALAFGFEDVAARARDVASRPFAGPALTSDARLRDMGYDAWRDIRHRPSQALWRAQGLPFEVQLFHVGGGHPNPVRLFEVVDGAERAWRVSRDVFDYGRALGGALPDAAEVAGFRVHHVQARPPPGNELIVFLGASYFRVPVAGRFFGMSARGIAVDTSGPGTEEFPIFEAFWLVRPSPTAATLTLYALLNSPRVAGAYRFVVRPGAHETTVDVQARLFLRQPVATLGIAPLTSMYLSGENQPRHDGFRPEVHDSDGLLVAGDGDWSWHPLVNPPAPFTRRLAYERLSGFGLLQRDRSFASYEDTEARYEQRPSVWVEPLGDWGAGRIELMQFNAAFEFVDNAVAYWVGERTPRPGEPYDIAWRLHWGRDVPPQPSLARVAQSRRGHGPTGPAPHEIHFVVDFAGRVDGGAPVQAKVGVTGPAELLEANVYPHPVLGGWRLTVKVRRTDKAAAVELRAVLQRGAGVVSETWRYALPPE
ncbi:glucan biosynthesis protein G [Piscinibacter sp. XHJ-5]|uniref:glucan biosynthesis protein G n=1 Tax=Piscinibacter sp. XHJ-5 TaxID=3037797 RepID=UPI002452BE74|nr:glucan biosynthesis protein G [Piscinibacter sp. XHJ-5]